MCLICSKFRSGRTCWAPDWKSDQFLVLNVAARTFLDHPAVKEVEGGGVLGGSSGQGPGLTETQVPLRTLGPILAVTPAPGIHELLPGCSDSLRAPPAKDSHSSGVQSHRTEPQLQVSPGELTVPREDLAKPQAQKSDIQSRVSVFEVGAHIHFLAVHSHAHTHVWATTKSPHVWNTLNRQELQSWAGPGSNSAPLPTLRHHHLCGRWNKSP